MSIQNLEVDRKYPIVRAERAETRYGPSALFTHDDSSGSLLKVFLPKRYKAAVSETDIQDKLTKFRRVWYQNGNVKHQRLIYCILKSKDTWHYKLSLCNKWHVEHVFYLKQHLYRYVQISDASRHYKPLSHILPLVFRRCFGCGCEIFNCSSWMDTDNPESLTVPDFT